MYEKTDKRDKRKPKMFDNTCGDCHIEGLRCIEFAVEASNQDNRNKCCCGHMKNMHKNAISQPADYITKMTLTISSTNAGLKSSLAKALAKYRVTGRIIRIGGNTHVTVTGRKSVLFAVANKLHVICKRFDYNCSITAYRSS
mmetsp:Transcript_9343/g.12790  ORF Transcript_9343/g.12790 Transcript_9343/m.12790 type:complete len:142 (-) Transcript_9343:485-910(-)